MGQKANMAKEKEYEDLRNEIKQKIEIHNSLITFMITAVVAILAFAVENDKALLYLLPFGIIIPISMRIAYYRSAMVKLSAYLIVYIENDLKNFKWETRNSKFENEKNSSFYDIVTISHYFEGIMLSIICYILFLWDYLKDKSFSCKTITMALIPLLLLLWESIITRRIARFNEERKKWIDKWSKFKSISDS